MTAPGNNVDTTSGGGGDFDGGANDPVYRPPTDGVPDDDGVTQDTTATPGGSVPDPAPAPHRDFDTTRGGGTDRNPDDDPAYTNAPPTPTPAENRDTTQLGGGIGGTVNQPYRAPREAPPASTTETGSQSGFVNVNPGSPDAEVVGTGSGLNPNAVEPGHTNAAHNVSTYATTGYGDGGPTHVPAGSGTPSAPLNVTATVVPNRRAVDIHWDAPANADATGVIGYVVESNTHGTQYTGRATTIEFEEGLEGGRSYTFTVYARTANGTGFRSAPSNQVTMGTGDLVADTTIAEGIADSRPSSPSAPAAPTAVADAGGTSATVSFTPPASSDPITEYRVTASTGQTVTGPASPLVVTGLTKGTAVTFTVAAKNVYGYGAESPASNSVTPVTVPGAPTGVTATPGAGGTASVAFTPPTDNGGSPITSYTVTSAPGGLTATGAGSPLTVTGLTAGTSYTFTATATNAVGTSAASAPSAAVTALA